MHREAIRFFFTDDERLAEAETIAQFDRIVVHQSEMLKQPASSLVETHFAGFLSHLLEESLELPAGSLLWAHAKGLTGPWDVPMEDRAALNAPDDPDPIPFVDPPHSDNLPEFPEDDPNAEEDYRLMIQQAYSAQVSMVDQLLGAFLEHADPIVSDSYLYFMSTRGYPLGEHDTIGTGDSLFPENVHLPLLIRPPNGTDGTRSRTLLQPTDVYTLLRSHFENRFDSALAQRNSLLGNPASEVSVLRNDQETALVTHAWKAIISKGDVKLFVKPDDRWDVNDISDRCPEVVQEMVELWNTIRNELGNTTTLGPIELPQSLTTPIR